MKVRLPQDLIQEMETLIEALNTDYKKLISVATKFNEFGEVNGLTEEEVNNDDLKIVELLEEAVDNFRSL